MISSDNPCFHFFFLSPEIYNFINDTRFKIGTYLCTYLQKKKKNNQTILKVCLDVVFLPFGEIFLVCEPHFIFKMLQAIVCLPISCSVLNIAAK